jgi:hypothetical protein
MIKNLLAAVLACVGTAAAPAYAEMKWRMGLELIQDWSLFHCVTSMPDRFWHFTLNDSLLRPKAPKAPPLQRQWQLTEGSQQPLRGTTPSRELTARTTPPLR